MLHQSKIMTIFMIITTSLDNLDDHDDHPPQSSSVLIEGKCGANLQKCRAKPILATSRSHSNSMIKTIMMMSRMMMRKMRFFQDRTQSTFFKLYHSQASLATYIYRSSPIIMALPMITFCYATFQLILNERVEFKRMIAPCLQ